MHKLIEEELKKNDELRQRLIGIEGPITEIESVLANRSDLRGYLDVTIGWGVSVTLNVHVDTLRKVAPFLRSLAKQGIHMLKGAKPTSNQFGRVYQLRVNSAHPPSEYHTDGIRTEPLTMNVFLDNPKANPTCKYVKVGEKTTDVYEWKCDDEEVEAVPAI